MLDPAEAKSTAILSDDKANREHHDLAPPRVLQFLLVHIAATGAIWSGITWQAIALGAALYWLRMFAICAGYHRYFSHRAYSTSRVFQFILAFLAQTSAQRSILWWAAKHRHHHLHSDTGLDVHSPRHRGFMYSHVGWIFAREHHDVDLGKVADFARYPELMWLHRFELMPAAATALFCFMVAGWSGLVVGFFWSTVLLYHATFCINSLAHVRGRKRYVTGDDSRNNWLLALLTTGEGWHNNHHAYQSSARQGFRWWEVDPTYYVLRALALVGIVWGLKTPPAEVLRNEQRLGSRVINRAAEQLAAHFNSERIALAVASALHAPDLSSLRDMIAHAHDRTIEILMTLHLPQIPSREHVSAAAGTMFARTRSLDEIVDRAYELLLTSVGNRVAAALRPVCPGTRLNSTPGGRD